MEDWLRYGLGVIGLLISALYAHNQYELRRLAKNIHQLRTKVQAVIITLASHGIIIKSHDDDE